MIAAAFAPPLDEDWLLSGYRSFDEACARGEHARDPERPREACLQLFDGLDGAAPDVGPLFAAWMEST